MAEEAPWLLAEGNSYGRFDHQGPYNYSTTIRAEEVNLDERCHQSVPSDRSISTLVNEAGLDKFHMEGIVLIVGFLTVQY